MSDAIAVLSWWLVIQVMGWAVWPIVSRWLRWLPDRGYMLAKPVGLLFVSYGLWLLATFGIVQNSAGGIIVVIGAVAAVSVWGYGRGAGAETRGTLRDVLKEHRRVIVAYEVLFVVALIGWAIFRAHNPDLSTTEKPMEFAFFNAINRSAVFPPQDPWLSGYGIAYYYFGYVMMSLLHIVSGVSIGTAYSLSNAFWFALAAASAFGVVANLVLAFKRQARDAALVAGVLGAVMLVLMGNLEAPLEVAHANNVGSPQFWSWLDIQDINTPAVQNPPDVPWHVPRPTWWWWRASRVIHDYPPDAISPQLSSLTGSPPVANSTYQELIDEFPQFSYLLGDMHPHVLALPFALLMMGLALNLYLAAARGEVSSLWSGPKHAPWWLLYALSVGALAFLNTWDFPIYAFVLTAALALGNWRSGNFKWQSSGLDLLVLGATGFVLFIPFYRGFSSQAAGIAPNLFNGTRLPQYFVMFGPFLVIGFIFGLALIVEAIRSGRVKLLPFIGKAILGGLGVLAALTVTIGAFSLAIMAVSASARNLVQGKIDSLAANGLRLSDFALVRVLDPWVPLILALSLVATWLLWRARVPRTVDNSQHGTREATVPVDTPIDFVLLLGAIGALLTLGTEFAFIIDGFGDRMNTVFKFYYQAWALWSVAAAFAVYYLLAGSEHIKPIGRAVAGVAIGLGLLLGMFYPVMGIQAKVQELNDPPSLDAMQYTGQSVPDELAAAQWFNQFVPGTPVILEAPGEEYNASTSRISTWTGLPSVIGWSGHEAQWRGNNAIQGPRVDDVREIYSSGDMARALTLLKQYDVRYVIVGPNEQRQYRPPALAKFAQALPVAFQQGAVTVYQVP